jgi:hypothetical protein
MPELVTISETQKLEMPKSFLQKFALVSKRIYYVVRMEKISQL